MYFEQITDAQYPYAKYEVPNFGRLTFDLAVFCLQVSFLSFYC